MLTKNIVVRGVFDEVQSLSCMTEDGAAASAAQLGPGSAAAGAQWGAGAGAQWSAGAGAQLGAGAGAGALPRQQQQPQQPQPPPHQQQPQQPQPPPHQQPPQQARPSQDRQRRRRQRTSPSRSVRPRLVVDENSAPQSTGGTAGRAAPRLLADGRACVLLQRVQAAVGGGTSSAPRLAFPSLPLGVALLQQRDVTQADLDTLRERHLARCDTDSWLYSPLLLAIFDIPVADAVVRATTLARAACERCEVGLLENLVQGYRAVYAEIGHC